MFPVIFILNFHFLFLSPYGVYCTLLCLSTSDNMPFTWYVPLAAEFPSNPQRSTIISVPLYVYRLKGILATKYTLFCSSSHVCLTELTSTWIERLDCPWSYSIEIYLLYWKAPEWHWPNSSLFHEPLSTCVRTSGRFCRSVQEGTFSGAGLWWFRCYQAFWVIFQGIRLPFQWWIDGTSRHKGYPLGYPDVSNPQCWICSQTKGKDHWHGSILCSWARI